MKKLQSSKTIGSIAVGNFSGTKQQEVIVSNGSDLELLDCTSGKIISILSTTVFGIVRGLAAFRLVGSSKDYIVASSDSGRIVILELDLKKQLKRVHMETYGRTGCRRMVPGQYLACDPRGRCLMVAAVEKTKLCYVLNRDAQTSLTISSPLEAHKTNCICHGVIGMDVGFDNPMFASIEVDYSDLEDNPDSIVVKQLVYYELDLGLNHVVRKASYGIDPSANHLVAIPGGNDGPSGVLVCSQAFVTWMHPRHPQVRVAVPTRPDYYNEQSINAQALITASVVHKLKRGFFVLLQNELGDVLKLTMDFNIGLDGSVSVDMVRIRYFDTLPVAAGLCLIKPGYLFVAAEFGNHSLFEIVNETLGDDDERQVDSVSADYPQDSLEAPSICFEPRELYNLALVDEMDSMAPLIDAQVLNLTDDDTPQIYALCGRGARSTFRVLRHGLNVSEMAVSDLPGNPQAVWTVRNSVQDDSDAYIVISFVNATLVLSVGETVEEVTDTGFLASTATICVAQLGDDALVQVYPQGIRYIRADKRVSEWKAPGNRSIVRAACSSRQVIVALSGGELVYFELDLSGHLNEFQERKEMAATVTCLAFSPIQEGRQRARFLAVGCSNNTIRLLSLDPETCLQSLSMQALSANPESIVIIEMKDSTTGVSSLYVNTGLQNGVLLRTAIDASHGQLSDTRLRFLGAKPVKLFVIKMNDAQAVLALSTQPWVSFSYQSGTKLIPLCYETLEYGSSFSAGQCPEGIVAITGNTLRIISVDNLSSVFNQTTVELKYTPRRFVYHEPCKSFVVVESDHGTWCPTERAKQLEENTTEEGGVQEELPTTQFGLPKAPPGKWGSCIRVINPIECTTTALIELDHNEAAFSIALCSFSTAEDPQQKFIVVGSATDLKLAPKSSTSGFLAVYVVNSDGSELELIQKTPIDGVPLALCEFNGKLLIGVGKQLRLYEMGKKKLLRKAECKGFPQNITSIHTQGARIVVGDAQDSIHYAMYRHFDNRIVIFADDPAKRYTTCTTMLDYDTVAAGDKFGNVFVLRLPTKVSTEIDNDPTGNKAVFDRGYLQGAPHKLEAISQYFIGDTVTSLVATSLVPGGRQVILYTTLLGHIGILVPFVSKDDTEIFQMLEMTLRNETPPLCGRDHLAFRSYYAPVKAVVDGDFCETFNALANEKKRGIAEGLDRSVADIGKKLEDMRTRVAF